MERKTSGSGREPAPVPWRGPRRAAPPEGEPVEPAARHPRKAGAHTIESSGGLVELGGQEHDERGGFAPEGLRTEDERHPYFGTRMGGWDDRLGSAAATEERARYASPKRDDHEGDASAFDRVASEPIDAPDAPP